jgi:hypothetical protein
MTPAIIIALTPLWLGLAGMVFVLTIGRRIAQNERAEREANREVPVQFVIPSSEVAAAASLVAQSVYPAGEEITRPKQSQSREQPPFGIGIRGRSAATGR